MRGSPLGEWATGAETVRSLARAAVSDGERVTLLMARNPLFTFHRSTTTKGARRVLSRPRHLARSMPLQHALACLFNTSHSGCGEHQYLSQGLQRGDRPPAVGCFEDGLAAMLCSGAARRASGINAWLGSRGVAATTNYDASSNLFVLTSGVKTFTFFPPAAHRRLHLHPRWHGSTRQAQPERLFAAHERAAREFGTHAVTLHRGDVLYIPAGVFHFVESRSHNVGRRAVQTAPSPPRPRHAHTLL